MPTNENNKLDENVKRRLKIAQENFYSDVYALAIYFKNEENSKSNTIELHHVAKALIHIQSPYSITYLKYKVISKITNPYFQKYLRPFIVAFAVGCIFNYQKVLSFCSQIISLISNSKMLISMIIALLIFVVVLYGKEKLKSRS